MANCSLCGAKIKPYFDICVNCSKKMEEDLGGFQEKIGCADFMKEMGINV